MKIRLLLLALMTFGLSMAVACGDLEEDCAPGDANDEGAICECTDDAGLSCDPDSDDEEDCVCGFPADDNSDNNSNNSVNNGDNNGDNNSVNNGDNNSVDEEAYLFLLIDDKTEQTSGSFPGFDGDAVTLNKADGGVFYASAVEDFAIVDGESATDPTAMLGAPDDGCSADATKFVALGGTGGYIILSFAQMDFDGRIENGDSLTIHEIGKTSCPETTYDDEPYSASVAVSLVNAQNGNFKVISSDALGEATLPVTGL